MAGDSFDFRDTYDLSDPKTQVMALKRVMDTEPTLDIGSPPCTMFSRIQKSNLHIHGEVWRQNFEEDKAKAALHIEFCLLLFKLQRARGAYFL